MNLVCISRKIGLGGGGKLVNRGNYLKSEGGNSGSPVGLARIMALAVRMSVSGGKNFTARMSGPMLVPNVPPLDGKTV